MARVHDSARCVVVAVAMLTAVAATDSFAAVRHCSQRIETSAEAATELAARQQALQRWIAGARRVGDTFTRWQLALGHAIHCTRSPAGHVCRASGAPCAISQQPNRVPQELQPPAPAPKKRGLDA